MRYIVLGSGTHLFAFAVHPRLEREGAGEHLFLLKLFGEEVKAISEIVPNLRDALERFDANPAFQNSIAGAHSAWRGFELQTMYICSRVLEGELSGCEYHPETAEDLLIWYGDSRVELVQVKAKDKALVLSDIIPHVNGTPEDNADSLLGHVEFFLNEGFDVSAKVVVFGTLGSELAGYSSGEAVPRQSVVNKVSHAFNDEMASFCATGLRFEVVDEGALLDALEEWSESRIELRAYPPIMINHLASEVRRLSLERGCLSAAQVEAGVRRLGVKLAAMAGAVRQYGNTIHPLSNLFSRASGDDIVEEYRLGVNARPEHVARGLDISRPHWLAKIEAGYRDNRIVIVRGASGQGKSTICYRYLLESGSTEDSYLIEGMESIEDARDICSFVVALSEARAETTFYLYVDGASGEAWKWLARQVFERSGSNVRMLVSIREEDYAAAHLSAKEFRSSEVVLTFGEMEARAIYACYEQSRYPSFEESWKSFGESGPLMEYTHSLSTGSSLRSMIGSQIDRLVSESDDSWVHALFLASLAGSKGLSTSLRDLREVTRCRRIAKFVMRANREHLLRGGDNGFIGPLHPHRSAVIAEILSEYCIEDSVDVAIGLVRCSVGGLGSLLVSWHDQHDGNMPSMEALVKACGDSWAKLSEVLKYAIWSDARRVYRASSGVRAELMVRRVSSWLPFTIGGGITKMSDVSGREALLEITGDEQWRETLRCLLDEAAGYRIAYESSSAALRAIDFSMLAQPKAPRELEAAGFCLSQYVACGCLDDVPRTVTQALANAFVPSDGPLSPQLDYALGLQLCGASLQNSACERLERRVNERHSIVWCKTSPDEVDILQVPSGKDGDLNDELVGALADLRRLHPGLEQYCGTQLGTDAFVPSDRMPSQEKRIPARNLPIYWLNVADRMFIAMCEYDDSMDDWVSMAAAVRGALSLFDRVTVGMTKWLDRCFEKGAFLLLKQSLIDDMRLLASRERQGWTVVDIPRSMRDPTGFCSHESPVDKRRVSKADGGSVLTKGSTSSGPLFMTSKMVAKSEVFGRCCCDLVFGMSGGSDKTEYAARRGVYILKDAIDAFCDTRRELEQLLDDPVLREDLEHDIVVLAVMLSHLAAHGVRCEHSVAYDAKLRARRLMNAGWLIVESVSRHQHNGGQGCPEDDLAVSIDLEDEDRIRPLEGTLLEAVKRCFREFDDVEHLSEFFLFPHYCRSLDVNLFCHGAYFGTIKVGGYQLERIAAGDTDILYLPSEERHYVGETDNQIVRTMRVVATIIQCCQYCSSVNSAIKHKDPSVGHLDIEAYGRWKEGMRREISELQDDLREAVNALPSQANPIVTVLRDLEDYIALIPDAANASELVTVLEDAQDALMVCLRKRE